MDDSLLSSPTVREHQPGMEWKTPERSKIRGWRADGKSYGRIMKMCGIRNRKPLVSRSTIRKIVKAPTSKRQRKGKATKKKLLEPADIQRVIRPHYVYLGPDQKEKFIFMEDGAKVHKGAARLWRLNHGIKGFDWPPSSPDLNPIEKVWRWMKHEITKLESVPTSKEDMKEVLRGLWKEVKPED
ncbi:hypothetical protein G7Y89_g11686 [Cudoniella acicularis]|uniref:Tc1-like transposase DDE domain-containing protein n=1 Tax=Cudoniella acicularis TaxID=354080 RepID=A0A8H4VXM7_9HELO|nr:hypothetical protein G7Y89_g11686 [Cudoniella acicularis]